MWNENDATEEKVTIIIQNKKYECNRKKLSDHSPYFDVMFHGNFVEKNEDCLTLQEVSVNGFINILKCIDEKVTFIENEYILDTLECTCMLQFESIKEICLKQLSYDLRFDNCLQIWQTAELLDLHPLLEQAKCKAFIEFNRVKNSDYFQLLEPKQLHSYLASHLIYCNSEMDIFEAGMKWWYEYSSNLQNDDEVSKYLLLVLSCIDFKSLSTADINFMLTFPDIASNNKINCILNEINSLISLLKDEDNKLPEQTIKEHNNSHNEISEESRKLLFNSKRQKVLLPCTLTTEFLWESEKKILDNELIMNISYYDEKNECLKKLINSPSQFQNHCSYSLIGCKILPYKENLILVGGELDYASNWNKSVWIYYINRDEWELLTIMPEERRHFESYIINNKLFLIGGTGKYRIRLNNNMSFYDFQTKEWTIMLNIPDNLNEKNVCEYKDKLLFLSIYNRQMSYAFLFDIEKKTWTKLTLKFTLDGKNIKFPESYLLFTKDEAIFLKGTEDNKFYEFRIIGSELTEIQTSTVSTIRGDKINFFLNNDYLYIFTEISLMEETYVLERFNIKTRTSKKLIVVEENSGEQWHINRGCFGLFHYSITENHSCISEFIL